MLRALFFVFVLCTTSLLHAQVPVIGSANKVFLNWDPVTVYADAAATPIPAGVTVQYVVALTLPTSDLNAATPGPTLTTAPAAQTATIPGTTTKAFDATSLFANRATGTYKLWLKASDGVTWSAWNVPLEVQFNKMIPAAPGNMKVTVTISISGP